MWILVKPNTKGPERLVGDAELHFEGELAGLKLAGFSLWRSAEGELYATLPSRSWGSGAERRFYDFLRSASDDPQPLRNLKDRLCEAAREQLAIKA